MKPYQLLKKNAPKIFKSYAKRKISILENEIKKLREDYKNETDQNRKEKIRACGIELRQELDEIKSLLEKQ